MYSCVLVCVLPHPGVIKSGRPMYSGSGIRQSEGTVKLANIDT